MKEYEKWFKKAENDLFAIKHLITLNDAPSDVCCFHAQQAAEKYLKAYLVAKNISFPKTHDLLELNKLCALHNILFLEIKEKCLLLKPLAVTPRYPDDIDDLTLIDAQQAYQNALAIKDFVTTHFFD